MATAVLIIIDGSGFDSTSIWNNYLKDEIIPEIGKNKRDFCYTFFHWTDSEKNKIKLISYLKKSKPGIVIFDKKIPEEFYAIKKIVAENAKNEPSFLRITKEYTKMLGVQNVTSYSLIGEFTSIQSPLMDLAV